MATETKRVSPKPFTFQIFDVLDSDFCNEDVFVRLIHFWEARNFNKSNLLMGVELLLIDSESTVVQGFIPAKRLFRYEKDLKRNTIYKLKSFLLTSCKKFYRVSDHKQGICFIDKTSMVQVHQGAHKIDEQRFRLRNFEEFSYIVGTNVDLFDVIGQLRLISGDNLHSPTTMETAPEVVDTRSTDRVFLHLLLKDGQTIRTYLWGNIAAAFRERWNQSDVKPNVLLITTVNPKNIGDAVTLSSTSATRLFFDNDVAETKKYVSWLGESGVKTPTVASSSSSVTKLETVTISELHQYLQCENPQEASFFCIATIVDILPHHGWYYISCSSCNTKLEKTDTSMYCNGCKKNNNVGLIRYRFEITVSDKNKDVATFVVLDREGIKIAGRRAADVLNETIEAADIDECEKNNNKTPECLKHIVGNTCKFQVKLTAYNFQASRQTVTISRIIENNITLPVEEADENSTTEAVAPQIAAKDGKAKSQMQSPNSDETTEGKKEKRVRLNN